MIWRAAWVTFGWWPLRLCADPAANPAPLAFCCGSVDPSVLPNPLWVIIHEFTSADAEVEDTCTGQQRKTGASWWTEDTTISTVDSLGNVYGFAPGATNVDAEVWLRLGGPFGCGDSWPETVHATVWVCPTSVTLSTSTPISLSSQFPTLKTGIGIIAAMQVNPISSNWNGTQVSESISQVSNTCPSSFGALCSGSDTFTVGAGATAFGGSLPATQNIFYDQHNTVSSTSKLDDEGQTSCAAVCKQTYYCNRQVIGTFKITRTFSKGTIQNTPVTNLSVTKEPQ